MANVTIGGLVDQAVTSTKATTAAGVTTTTKSIGPTSNGTSELHFSGSEDLGDGMKASFRLGLNMTADDNGASTTANSSANGANRISYVELTGGFGGIQLGQQWEPGFFVVLAADPTNLTGSTAIVGPAQFVGYTANSITYNAPSFVPGLAIQYQMGRGEASASNAGNSSGYSLTYNNGPLAVAYDLGMVKVNAYNISTKLAGTTSKHSGSGFGLSVPVSASTRLAVLSSGATGTNGSGTQEKEKGTKYAVFHNLSKRTMAYGFVAKGTTTGASNAYGQTAFGLMHSF